MVRAISDLRSGGGPRRYFAVALVIGVIVEWSATLWGQGARPIEFSESRGGTTNAPDPGASRSRLDSLETQISKSFDFLNSDESLRGAQAPVPRVPSRTPAPRQPRKKPGLFDDDEAWIRSDPLRESDPELESSEWSAADRRPRSATGPGINKAPWMDQNALSDEFWQLSAGADAPPSSRLLPDKEDLLVIAPKVEPFLENLFGLEPASRSPSVADFEQSSPFSRSWGLPVHSGETARQEQYRGLLGFEAPTGPGAASSPALGQPATSGWDSRPPRSSPWTASPWSSPGASRSLSPVQMAEERPLLPLTPVAPERPSVQSLYDWDQGAATPAPSASPATSPFQSPVRRGFP